MDLREHINYMDTCEPRSISYYKAYIKLYQMYYHCNLHEAYEVASNDFMHSEIFDDDIGILIDAYFEMKNECQN